MTDLKQQCVPPDPGIAAVALGARESGTLLGTAPAEAFKTFALDSGASPCFFRDSTTLTPLPAPVPVRLADPSGGPVVARSSTVLPCPTIPSGSLSCLHLPSFSTNLVSTTALQDAMVTTTTPGGQCVSICTCTRTGRHLARFTRRPGSSLYTLATESPQVAASAQVSASGPVAPPCSCRLLSHKTLLWHHRLGHPSLPRLCGMHSRLLVSGLPRSLPPLPPSPAPPCLPCVEGRQCATPHSSSFPLTTAPLQTLHMDMWGPARVSGQGRERYFLLVVDDYTRLSPAPERFRADLPVLCLHSDRGGEFSSDLLREFCRGEGILQSFTLLDSPSQNGIAECRIGLVMEVARTSMIHAAAPHFLWPFARWTGKVGDASVFRVWGSRAFVRDTSADKLSARAIPCGPAPSGVSQVDPLPGLAPVEVAVGSGAASGGAASEGAESGVAESEGAGSGGAEPGGEEPGGAETEGVEPGGVAPEDVEPGGAESEGVESGGAESQGAALSGGCGDGAGGAGAGGTGSESAGARGAGVGGTGAGGAGAGGTDAGGAGIGGTGAGGAGAGGAGAVDPGGTVRPRPNFFPLLQHVFGVSSSTSLTPPLLCPLLDQTQLWLQPASPLLAPSPYTEQSVGLTEHREPASRPVLPVHTARRVPRSRPPPVPGMHAMALRPSSVPLRVPLPDPFESSLPEVPDPESDRACAASPTISCLLATVVTDPSFESTAASTLVAELLDFAAAFRLDYASALVAESESDCPPSVEGECALGTDVLEDRHEEFESLAAAVSRFVM
ncbi:unnamed protein product [Closterium sp. NIES-54]